MLSKWIEGVNPSHILLLLFFCRMQAVLVGMYKVFGKNVSIESQHFSECSEIPKQSFLFHHLGSTPQSSYRRKCNEKENISVSRAHKTNVPLYVLFLAVLWDILTLCCISLILMGLFLPHP